MNKASGKAERANEGSMEYFIKVELYGEKGKQLGAAGYSGKGKYRKEWLDERGELKEEAVRSACESTGVEYERVEYVYAQIRLL